MVRSKRFESDRGRSRSSLLSNRLSPVTGKLYLNFPGFNSFTYKIIVNSFLRWVWWIKWGDSHLKYLIRRLIRTVHSLNGRCVYCGPLTVVLVKDVEWCCCCVLAAVSRTSYPAHKINSAVLLRYWPLNSHYLVHSAPSFTSWWCWVSCWFCKFSHLFCKIESIMVRRGLCMDLVKEDQKVRAVKE